MVTWLQTLRLSHLEGSPHGTGLFYKQSPPQRPLGSSVVPDRHLPLAPLMGGRLTQNHFFSLSISFPICKTGQQ